MGWRWFAGWALVGGALFFTFLTVLSIGLFVAPAALVLLVLVVRRARPWPESLGAVTGVGAVCVAVAALNWADQTGEGALNAARWLTVGALLVASGTALYAAARRHEGSPPVV